MKRIVLILSGLLVTFLIVTVIHAALPFRYRWYHDAADTPDKLDFDAYTYVVSMLTPVITDLAQ